jgi:hypothetical protein
MKNFSAVMFALCLGLGGCSSTVTDTANSSVLCSLPRGGNCPPGMTCPAGDGCNTCTCGAGQSIMCTELACLDAGPTQDVPRPGADAGGDVVTADAGADVVAVADARRVCQRSTDCAAGERCVYAPQSACGESDEGVCQSVPGCESLPVAPQFCGCDGRTFQMPNACPPDRPFVSTGPCPERGAVMLWQAPGGFAGTGPAVRVQGDGTVWVWRSTSELTLTGTTPMPDMSLRLSPALAADLFARWDRVDLTGLPHGPSAASDCYPSVTVQRCATCMPVRLRYASPAQITPEMNGVWAWFEANTPTARPQTFCAF